MSRPAIFALIAGLSLCTPALARDITLNSGDFTVEPVVTGLEEPWAIGVLPSGDFLITERDGRLLYVTSSGAKTPVSGLPRVRAQGQGGLLDILIPNDFAQSREVFFTYSKRQSGGAGTALGRGVLSDDGTTLTQVRTLWEMAEGSSGGRHFGSRIVEGRDGTLFVTIGDRGDRDTAQDLAIESGTVVRLNRDGSIPADNPFVGTPGAQPAIWSYGHRNPQGAAMGRDGTLFVVEHGARGRDEVNVVRKGANYGWPVISYGTHYSGFSIGEGTAKAGMEQPAHYWDPSIAPSGAVVHSGTAVSDWHGDLFVGSLKFDYIARMRPSAGMAEIEQISLPETGRVRDVQEDLEGALLFLSVHEGAMYRIAPKP